MVLEIPSRIIQGRGCQERLLRGEFGLAKIQQRRPPRVEMGERGEDREYMGVLQHVQRPRKKRKNVI